MNDLSALPNIGTVLFSRLTLAGITTPAELKALGAKQAYLRVREIYPDACLNHLYAIEGAIQNIRWHYLDDQIKKDLKVFYQAL